MSQLNTKQTPIYGNTKVLDPDGELLFLCLPKKAHWYLDRNLATMITEDPMVIQLTFEPKGKGQVGDAYALGEKYNKCVVCGTEDDLTRHHIVPYTYRKHFPETMKSHNSHDIVPICVGCHGEYEENYGIELKYVLAKKYDAPLESLTKVNTDLSLVVKYSKLLMDRWDKLPCTRKKQMMAIIREYHGHFGKMRHIILTYAYFDLSESQTESHGQIVVGKIIENNQLQWFVETWREHFINSMEPKYMPKHWDIKREI